MKHRISGAALIFNQDKLLLVKHINPTTKHTWWVPPGGGCEGEENVFAAAKRETFEETGLDVVLEEVVYVRQLLYKSRDLNQITFYILASCFSGEITTKHINKGGADKDYIKEVGFFSQEEMQEMNVYPEELKDKLWEDRNKGFAQGFFLEIQKDKENKN